MILIGRLNDRMADPALKHVSSFSALEALAYDEPTTSETAQNSDRRESSMSPKVTSRQAWGWKSRLLEAQADLSQYKRRQGRSRASPEPSISPSNNETTSPVSPQAFRRSVTPSYSPKRCDINSHTEQLSTDEQKAPLDETPFLKAELKSLKEENARLSQKLEESKRDRANIYRLWESDRSKLQGLQRRVESAFQKANEELRQRLGVRNGH